MFAPGSVPLHRATYLTKEAECEEGCNSISSPLFPLPALPSHSCSFSWQSLGDTMRVGRPKTPPPSMPMRLRPPEAAATAARDASDPSEGAPDAANPWPLHLLSLAAVCAGVLENPCPLSPGAAADRGRPVSDQATCPANARSQHGRNTAITSSLAPTSQYGCNAASATGDTSGRDAASAAVTAAAASAAHTSSTAASQATVHVVAARQRTPEPASDVASKANSGQAERVGMEEVEVEEEVTEEEEEEVDDGDCTRQSEALDADLILMEVVRELQLMCAEQGRPHAMGEGAAGRGSGLTPALDDLRRLQTAGPACGRLQGATGCQPQPSSGGRHLSGPLSGRRGVSLKRGR